MLRVLKSISIVSNEKSDLVFQSNAVETNPKIFLYASPIAVVINHVKCDPWFRACFIVLVIVFFFLLFLVNVIVVFSIKWTLRLQESKIIGVD